MRLCVEVSFSSSYKVKFGFLCSKEHYQYCAWYYEATTQYHNLQQRNSSLANYKQKITLLFVESFFSGFQ